MRKTLRLLGLTSLILAASWMAFAPAEDAVSVKSVDSKEKTDAISTLKSGPVEGEFVVHEWGTFTTFSGSDGLFLDFRPLAAEDSDLPNFVFDRASRSPLGLSIKRRVRGRVRMETPVTYFYTDRIRDVDVRVDFPEGLLTEFYPPVREMLPKFDQKLAFTVGEPLGNSRLDWGTVTLIPNNALVPGISDAKLQAQVASHLAGEVLPRGANDNHYIQARATDSALVHVRGSVGPTTGDHATPEQSFLEKFLFYRGVGNFQLPYQTEFDSQGQIVLRNHGELPLNSAILIRVNGDQLHTTTIDRLDGGQSQSFGPLNNVTLDELSTIVKEALVGEGLYVKEAASMVETWKQSWFSEEGTRVLYMVPGSMTDELLPLNISPRPQETLRVLVGRMEIMSPEVEQRMIETVAISSQQRAQFIARTKDQKDNQEVFPVPDPIRLFGRLAEPALVRVAMITRDSNVKSEAELLIAQLRVDEDPQWQSAEPVQL